MSALNRTQHDALDEIFLNEEIHHSARAVRGSMTVKAIITANIRPTSFFMVSPP